MFLIRYFLLDQRHHFGIGDDLVMQRARPSSRAAWLVRKAARPGRIAGVEHGAVGHFRLLDLGFFRIGGESYAEANNTFGLAIEKEASTSRWRTT